MKKTTALQMKSQQRQPKQTLLWGWLFPTLGTALIGQKLFYYHLYVD